MYLKHLFLQNFRNYSKAEFNFSKSTTLVVGPNTAGKTNLIEAIFFLSTGKSFRGRDEDAICFGKEVGRIRADNLEIVFANREGRFIPHRSGAGFIKKYLVNGVSKQRVNFVGRLPSVLFTPSDLEIITSSPGTRRSYLDSVLEQADREYRRASNLYKRAISSRNRLLENAKKLGRRNQELFDYWDNLIIVNGNLITETRASFIDFVNNSAKEVFNFHAEYDKSLISKDRLLEYKDAELAAGVTLVGPHRDDFVINIFVDKNSTARNIKAFGSRGQQRLAVLQLKIIELKFLTEKLGEKPLLLLDDIFSELDSEHIDLVLEQTRLRLASPNFNGQAIITTTHKEFVGKKFLEGSSVIELGS